MPPEIFPTCPPEELINIYVQERESQQAETTEKYNFRYPDGKPVDSEAFMMILENLGAMHILGSYYSLVDEIRLMEVELDVASENRTGQRAMSVEQCQCPHGFSGASCEDCADRIAVTTPWEITVCSVCLVTMTTHTDQDVPSVAVHYRLIHTSSCEATGDTSGLLVDMEDQQMVQSSLGHCWSQELCRTRCVERKEIFIDFLPAMVEAMSQIMSCETRSTASAEISGFLLAARQLMWSRLCRGQGCHWHLQCGRFNSDDHHRRWYHEAAGIAEALGVEPSMPRTCGRQTKKANAKASTPEEFYQRDHTAGFIDTLLLQINERFGELQRTAAMGLTLTPKHVCANPANAAYLDWFLQDMPSPLSLESELHIWQQKWKMWNLLQKLYKKV
ncbi:PGBM-like protein [Mya arenaria]|uniref:PGBM-like protein n=1 Tax=Mya arenaria TaxID=6604 RepID=A0ABY7EKY3_MYAAR|nr:PGBM-like protein [Mya arenaria]